jgi:hypothetical protein
MLRKLLYILLICVGALVAAAIYGAWRWLGWYIAPVTATDRKDHVQVMAVSLGAVGAIITAIIGWRNLKQSQRSTETTLANTREVEEERAQNDALQKYLEQMGQLLTREGLRRSEDLSDDVRILARSQTLTVLAGLGPGRKRILLRFLYESHLIDRNNAFVILDGADLRGADLSRAVLVEADLGGADLSDVDLRAADLSNADLTGALGVDSFSLERQASSLEGATMPDGSKHA